MRDAGRIQGSGTDTTRGVIVQPRYRHNIEKRIRAGLGILAAPTIITGIWAIFAPASWYSDYGHGVAPPSAFGAYNEHFVQDLGSGYLGVGAVLLAATVILQRHAVTVALVGFLAFTLPHLAVHVVEAGGLDGVGYAFTTGVLGLGVGLALWIGVLNSRRTRSGEQDDA